MRLHVLQHVPFETPANLGEWARARGHALSTTAFYRGDSLPGLDAFDGLVVLGGPMNVDEYGLYPWLAAERAFVRRVIDADKRVLGICLGAQLLAAALGSPVVRNAWKEIGWHRVELTEAARRLPLCAGLPDAFVAFHWHGDTFAVPPAATHLAASAACGAQAFCVGPRVLGLQFHLEYSRESIAAMLAEDDAEVAAGGPYVQTRETMLAAAGKVDDTRRVLYRVLDNLAQA